MERGIQGALRNPRLTAETYQAYIPASLPPVPPIAIDGSLLELLEQANRALGRLDGAALVLPNVSLLLYLYVRKEAVLSSQIEGTQSSLSDLLLFEHQEVPGAPLDDVREVSSYVAALEHGMKRLGDLPLSTRLLREVHGILLREGRGSDCQPGEFRRSQNWIGGTRPGNAAFVPPPQEEVGECMRQLENFIHDVGQRTPPLVKAALAHVQFETIHPFLDGNGRVGRLMITLLLCEEQVLQKPLLYLSYYFKKNRAQYYNLLTQVRQQGDWEAWLEFFLTGIRDTADQAAATAKNIVQLFDKDRRAVESLGRSAGTGLRIHALMQRRPLLTIAAAAGDLGISYPTASAALGHLTELGIVREVSGRERNRLFTYDAYMKLLNEGTEPL